MTRNGSKLFLYGSLSWNLGQSGVGPHNQSSNSYWSSDCENIWGENGNLISLSVESALVIVCCVFNLCFDVKGRNRAHFELPFYYMGNHGRRCLVFSIKIPDTEKWKFISSERNNASKRYWRKILIFMYIYSEILPNSAVSVTSLVTTKTSWYFGFTVC